MRGGVDSVGYMAMPTERLFAGAGTLLTLVLPTGLVVEVVLVGPTWAVVRDLLLHGIGPERLDAAKFSDVAVFGRAPVRGGGCV